jgi:Family of unknown function (DUF5926)/SEC-C motif
MGKKARRAATATPADRPRAATTTGEIPVVGGREPCPCGSGRRYKACHGRAAAQAAQTLVQRPFEGLPGECDWIALREMVSAATARLTLTGEHAGREVTLATVLPMAWPAITRADSSVLIGLQTHASSGDVSRDVADALLQALQAEPGNPVVPGPLPGPGPRLQDLLDLSAPLEVIVHEGFDFWLEPDQEVGAEVTASLERANAAVVPTARLATVEAAYWCQVKDRRHLRWVLPHEENILLDALARLHAAGESGLGEGTRYVGSFRAHGLLVPVWDLPADADPDDMEEPAAAFEKRLADALTASTPLSAAERRARNGLLSRQLTLR